MSGPTVALVSGDLLLGSRLRAALAGTAAVRPARTVADIGDAATVFVDLNADGEARIELVAELHERGDVRIVGFCQHDERDLRVRAMAAGADQVVTNGALQEAALRILRGASRA